MNTCDQCKHWNKPVFSGEQDHRRYCDHAKLNDAGEIFEDGAADTGDYMTEGIATGPKFGCVHFETALVHQSVKTAIGE